METNNKYNSYFAYFDSLVDGGDTDAGNFIPLLLKEFPELSKKAANNIYANYLSYSERTIVEPTTEVQKPDED